MRNVGGHEAVGRSMFRRAAPPAKPVGAIVLTGIAGAAVTAYSSFVVSTAYSVYVHCNPPGRGYVCSYHPLWGLNPTLFLVAALIGVFAGAVLFVLAYLLFFNPRRHAEIGTFIIVVALVSLAAYGGAIVGTALGVVGGVFALRYRPRGSVSEWAGAFPVGAPPARSPPKALADRRSVVPWEEPMINPHRSRATPDLPGAAAGSGSDAASASRSPAPAAGARPGAPVPPALTVVPTPSRVGLPRSIDASSAWQSPGGPPAIPAAPADRTPSASTPAPVPVVRAVPAHGISPTSLPRAAVPSRPAPAAVPPPRPAAPSYPPSRTTAATTRYGGAPALPRSSRAPATGAMRSPGGPVPSTRSPVPATPPSRTAVTPGPALPPSVPSVPPSLPTAAPVRAEAPPASSALPGSRRTRVWVCPQCKLVNAPWSAACTRCRTAAPP